MQNIMPDNDLFHAYIIGGARENSLSHIKSMLGEYNIETEGNPDCVFSEYVTFTVDHARELRRWQDLAPFYGARKIHVVCADFITIEAENALLKTLEEPVAGTHIVFALPNPHVLLPTLLSRVRVIFPDMESISEIDGEKFLSMTLVQRMKVLSKIVEKSDEEESSAIGREKALLFVSMIEKTLYEKINKETKVETAKKLEYLLRVKSYLYIPGCSTKMILESLALSI